MTPISNVYKNLFSSLGRLPQVEKQRLNEAPEIAEGDLHQSRSFKKINYLSIIKK